MHIQLPESQPIKVRAAPQTIVAIDGDETTERCRTKRAHKITGLPTRTLQALAKRGEIPGAAKLGARWTFDEIALRRWIKLMETEQWPITSSSAATSGGRASKFEDSTLDAAYQRAIGLKPKRDSPRS